MPTAQFYSKFSSVLAGAGLLGGALLTEAIDRDDDWDRDDNRGYGDLQHYFTVLPFYSCLCLSIQTTVVMMEVISVGMEATFFRYLQPTSRRDTPFNLTGFVHNRPEIFFSLLTSSFSFHCPIYHDLLWLFLRMLDMRTTIYLCCWQRNRILYSSVVLLRTSSTF